MLPLLQIIRKTRQAQGLTQLKLASQSQISLATLQALEAGRANPGWDTLERLGKVLGLQISFQPIDPNWELLIHEGLPLTSLGPPKHRRIRAPADGLILKTWVQAWNFCHGRPGHERELEALHAYTLALRTHFPSVFLGNWKKNPAVQAALRRPVTGRAIKLRRISISRMAEIR